MKRANLIRLVVVSLLLVLCPGISPAKEYVLTVGNEQLRFVPQGEKGYVIKQPKRTAGISALAGTLFLEQGRVQPIGGLDRHGVWIVENDGPASRNDEIMTTLAAGAAAEYVAPLFSSYGETVAVIPEIVIRVRPGIEMEEVQILCESAGCTIKKRMEFTIQEYLLEVLGPDAEAVFAAVEELSQSPEVEWACPNTASRLRPAGETTSAGVDMLDQSLPHTYASVSMAPSGSTASGVFPNDEYFPMQWHLHNTGQSGGMPGVDIRAPEAWEITTGDPNIVVALLDCGVDTSHPDLIDNLVPGYDFYDNDGQPDPALDHPLNTHGTNCAGLIVAHGNNGIGTTGVTWKCRIMPVRVWGVRANGTWYDITSADGATALRWAAAHGADIFSDSWCPYSSDQPILRSAIVDVTMAGGLGRDGKGCIYLSAAGNDAGPLIWYPTKYPEVIAVGATDHNDMRCSYSSYGPQLDIVAPTGWQWTNKDWASSKGKGALWTTDISGVTGWNLYFDPNVLDYTVFTGTSGSCPIAAGVAALILSVEPNLTSDEVRHFLERSAKDLGNPGWDQYYGWGRVDARAALDMVLAKRADLNNDWKVDFSDFAVFAQCWKTDDLRGDIGPIPRPDGVLDVQDLALMGEYWLKEIPELGVFAHWKLDETEGVIAHEKVQKRDGALHGSPTWQPTAGKVNGALEFDGIDDYVSTPFILNPSSGPFSAFIWVKDGSPGQAILSQVNGRNWLSAETGTGALMSNLTIGLTPQPLSSQAVITDGDWHRVGVSWDGASLVLYADGVEVAKKAQSGTVGSTAGLYIGAGKGLDAGSFFSGLIDDVRIYDRAITP